MPRHRPVIPARIALVILALVLGLPLAGALWSGRPLAEFTRFPPPLKELPRFASVCPPRSSWN